MRPSTQRGCRRPAWGAALLLWLLPWHLAVADSWNEEALVQALAARRTPQVAFSETRHLSYLDVPLHSEGVLEFRPPDYLKRSVPATGEVFEITGDRLRIGSRELDLDAYPGLRAFAESFRATLSGDVIALRRHFTLRLHGSRAQWQLELTPRAGELAAVLASITLAGNNGRLDSIETLERGGDRTVTRLRALP